MQVGREASTAGCGFRPGKDRESTFDVQLATGDGRRAPGHWSSGPRQSRSPWLRARLSCRLHCLRHAGALATDAAQFDRIDKQQWPTCS